MARTRDDALEIPVDDQHIAGTLVTPGTLIPGVLFVHGWGGSQQQYVTRAREVAALGCICLTFDLRGHARTQDQQKTVTREDNLHDILAGDCCVVGIQADRGEQLVQHGRCQVRRFERHRRWVGNEMRQWDRAAGRHHMSSLTSRVLPGQA